MQLLSQDNEYIYQYIIKVEQFNFRTLLMTTLLKQKLPILDLLLDLIYYELKTYIANKAL